MLIAGENRESCRIDRLRDEWPRRRRAGRNCAAILRRRAAGNN